MPAYNPYQGSMYYPGTMPYGQPYQPQYGQPMQTSQMISQPQPAQQISQQVSQPSVRMGRIVSNPAEISAQDVNMDGSMTLFPSADGRVIYGRSWQPNGQIAEIRYVPEQQNNPQANQDPMALIMGQLGEIKNDLNGLKESMARRPKPYNKNQHKNSQNGQNGTAQTEAGE